MTHWHISYGIGSYHDRPFYDFGASMTFLSCIKIAEPLILRLWNCERVGRDPPPTPVHVRDAGGAASSEGHVLPEEGALRTLFRLKTREAVHEVTVWTNRDRAVHQVHAIVALRPSQERRGSVQEQEEEADRDTATEEEVPDLHFQTTRLLNNTIRLFWVYHFYHVP